MRGIQRLTIRDDLIARRVDYWDSLAFILQVDPTVRAALSAWISNPMTFVSADAALGAGFVDTSSPLARPRERRDT